MRKLVILLIFFSISLGVDEITSNYDRKHLENNNPFYQLSKPSFKAQYFTNEGFRAAMFGVDKIAKSLFYKACVMGDELACLSFNNISNKKLDSKADIGRNYSSNIEYFKKYKSSLREDILDDFKVKWYLSKSCRLGNTEACILESLRIRPYIHNDRQELGNACNYNYAKACYELANIYLFGIDITRNVSLAINLMKKSCNIGFNRACIDYIMLLSRK